MVIFFLKQFLARCNSLLSVHRTGMFLYEKQTQSWIPRLNTNDKASDFNRRWRDPAEPWVKVKGQGSALEPFRSGPVVWRMQQISFKSSFHNRCLLFTCICIQTTAEQEVHGWFWFLGYQPVIPAVGSQVYLNVLRVLVFKEQASIFRPNKPGLISGGLWHLKHDVLH